MYLSRIITLLLLCAFSLANAQDLDVQWGEEIDSRTKILRIIGQTDNGHYALAFRSEKYYIEYYEGETRKQQFSTQLKMPTEERTRTELKDIFYVDGALRLFTWAYLRSTKEMALFGYILDEKGNIQGTGTKLLSTVVEKRGRRGFFNLRVSRDQTKIFAAHSAPYRKNKADKTWQIHALLLTSDLETLIDIDEKLPLKEGRDRIQIADFHITEGTTVYIAAQWIGMYRGSRISRQFKIFQYDPSNGFEKREYTLDGDNRMATSISISSDADGNMLGAGFYSERNAGFFNYEGIAGLYFVRIDRTQEAVTAYTMEPFSRDLAAALLPAWQVNRGHLVPNLFVPRNMIVREDGGVILTAEYSFETFDAQARIRTFVNGPILAASINPEGLIDWMYAIPKNQVFSRSEGGLLVGILNATGAIQDGRMYHSFLMGLGDDGSMHFIYNDHPKNITLRRFRDTRRMTNFKRAALVSVTVDKHGHIKKEILADKDRSEVIFRPKISHQLPDHYDKVIVYGNRRKMDKFGIISF